MDYLGYMCLLLISKLLCSSEGSVFDPLGINPDVSSSLNANLDNFFGLLSQTFESTSSTKKEKSSARGVAGSYLDL